MESNLSSRQSEIINAAIKLIGEGGIQAMTIKNLSSEIGISESAIYRHFESKTEVLSALLEYLKSIVIAHYANASKGGSPIKRIEAMISGHLKIFADNPPYAIVILSDGIFKNEKALQEKIFSIMQYSKTVFINVIDEGKKAGEIRKDVSSEQIAFIIMGSVRLTINQWSISGLSFDLQKRGNTLFESLKTLISNQKRNDLEINSRSK